MSMLPSLNVAALKAKLPFFKRPKSGSHMRAHQRIPTCLMGELLIPEKGIKLEGLIIEVSRGGIRFREASSFILNRQGTTVVVQVADAEFSGQIVNVGLHGYGIKLDTLMGEDEMDRLAAMGKPQGLNPN